MHWQDTFQQDGYAVVPAVLEAIEVNALLAALDASAAQTKQRGGSVFAMRNVLETVPQAAALARDTRLHGLAASVLGPNCFAVRGLLFDKTLRANWKVNWHQDRTIAVRERCEVAGFGSWSVKDGVVHVQPPVALLESMAALRLHLDDCTETNGPLRVLPGSHREGRFGAEDTAKRCAAGDPLTVTAAKGGVILMRPLLLHSSSPAQTPGHRRVLHIEYACEELPAGLQWASRC